MPRVPAFVWAVVVGLCLFWIALGSRMVAGARAHDFLNLYTGASLAGEGRFAELHDPDVQLERERRYVPQLGSPVPFVRPAFYAAILAPLALVPYRAAFVFWIALQTGLMLACWTWGWKKFGADALVFAALFLPGPLGIASGQDCVVLLAILLAAYELALRDRPGASGAVLALMLIKFHLVLLWPVALIVQRRWRMLGGFCVAGAAEAIASLWLGGFGGAKRYVALLNNKSLDRLSPSPEFMISYEGLAANLRITAVWAIAAFIAVVVVVLILALRRAPLWRMFALTPLASLMVVPHVYAYDGTLLQLPVWLIIFQSVRPASRIAATLFSTPVPFGFTLADKPWAAVGSASLAAVFAILSGESLRDRKGKTLTG